MLLHPPEAALLPSAHRIEIYAAPGIAEIPHLVLTRLFGIEKFLKLRGIGIVGAIGDTVTVSYGVADTRNFDFRR